MDVNNRLFGQDLSLTELNKRSVTKGSDIAVSDKENIIIQRFAIESTSSSSVTKKITLTEAEKSMNGAPEGEIFDVVVKTDAEIVALEGSKDDKSIVQTKFNLIYKKCNEEAATWADLYGFIEMVRCVILYHEDAVDDETVRLSTIMLFKSLESLRSSAVHNGIHCARAMIVKYHTRLPHNDIQRLFSALINRTATGPRFICETAIDALKGAALAMPGASAIFCLAPSLTHKNHAAVDVAVMIVCELTKRLSKESDAGVCVSDEANVKILPLIIKALACGLESKKAHCKTLSRDALKFVKTTLLEVPADSDADGAFKVLVISSVGDGTAAAEIFRSLKSETPNAKSVLSPRPSAIASATSTTAASSISKTGVRGPLATPGSHLSAHLTRKRILASTDRGKLEITLDVDVPAVAVALVSTPKVMEDTVARKLRRAEQQNSNKLVIFEDAR